MKIKKLYLLSLTLIFIALICNSNYPASYASSSITDMVLPGGKNYLDPESFTVNGDTLDTNTPFMLKSDTNYFLSLPQADYLCPNSSTYSYVLKTTDDYTYLNNTISFSASTKEAFKTRNIAAYEYVTLTISCSGISNYLNYYGFESFQLEEGTKNTSYEEYVKPATDSTEPEFSGAGIYYASIDDLPSINTIQSNLSAYDDIDGDITDQIIVTHSEYSTDITTLGEYDIHFEVNDDASNNATAIITVRVVDIYSPIISLIGDEQETVNYKSTYTDNGTNCSDNYDATCVVTTTGTVDTNNIGNYTLHYNATDSSGNHADAVSRTITVADIESPVITLNGQEDITISFDENYEELGAICSDNFDFECTVSTDTTVENGVIGTYEVSYNAIDSSGNQATEVIRTVNIKDFDAPIITLNGNEVVYVEYMDTYTDFGATCYDNYHGTCIAIVDSNVDTTSLGTYYVTYNQIDQSNNQAIEIIRTVIVQDTTNPIISLNGDETIYVNHNSIFTDESATCFDNYDKECTVSTTSNVDTSTLGNYNVIYFYTDSSGNYNEKIRNVVVYDADIPTIYFSLYILDIDTANSMSQQEIIEWIQEN